ncbi:hypothetical protein ACLOJK_008345 [Asimina triloba]
MEAEQYIIEDDLIHPEQPVTESFIRLWLKESSESAKPNTRRGPALVHGSSAGMTQQQALAMVIEEALMTPRGQGPEPKDCRLKQEPRQQA